MYLAGTQRVTIKSIYPTHTAHPTHIVREHLGRDRALFPEGESLIMYSFKENVEHVYLYYIQQFVDFTQTPTEL